MPTALGWYERVTSKVLAQTRGRRAGRIHSDWNSWVKGSSPKVPLRLTPSMGLNLPICGTALLRSDGKGASHYAAAIPPPSDRFLICDGRRTRHVSALDIQHSRAEADDHSTILSLRWNSGNDGWPYHDLVRFPAIFVSFLVTFAVTPPRSM